MMPMLVTWPWLHTTLTCSRSRTLAGMVRPGMAGPGAWRPGQPYAMHLLLGHGGLLEVGSRSGRSMLTSLCLGLSSWGKVSLHLPVV